MKKYFYSILLFTCCHFASADVLQYSIALTPAGVTIPSSFLGIGTGYSTMTNFMGTISTGVNPVFVQLMSYLNPNNNGPASIRLGGDATDNTWWNPYGGILPAGIQYNLTPAYLTQLKNTIDQTHSKLILGLNMAQDTPRYASDLASAALSTLSSANITSFEIGNEPDLYSTVDYPGGKYTNPESGRATARPSSWEFYNYLTDFGNFVTELQSAIPGINLTGEVFAKYQGPPDYIANNPTFLDAQKNNVNLLSIHAYPLDGCNSSLHLTISDLMQNSSSEGIASTLGPYITQDTTASLPMQLTEINSADCGGYEGVSNVFASALWALDSAFALANAGIRGINFFTANTAIYALYNMSYSNGTFSVHVNPIYYGLVFFAQATGSGAFFVPVSTSTPSLTSTTSVWATETSTTPHQLKVVIISKDTDISSGSNVSLAINIPAATGNATLTQLYEPADDGTSTSGIKIFGDQTQGSGETFDNNVGGELVGTPGAQTIIPSGGTYSFHIPKLSAALLTVEV